MDHHNNHPRLCFIHSCNNPSPHYSRLNSDLPRGLRGCRRSYQVILSCFFLVNNNPCKWRAMRIQYKCLVPFMYPPKWNWEIGTEAAQFPEKENINGIFVTVHLTLQLVDLFRRRKKGEQEKEELDICKRSVDTLALIRGELLVFSGETRRLEFLKKYARWNGLLFTSKSTFLALKRRLFSRKVTFSAHTPCDHVWESRSMNLKSKKLWWTLEGDLSSKVTFSAPKSRLHQ